MIVLGVLAAIAASLFYNGGIVLQALEAREQPREHGLRITLLARLARRRRWLAGTALTVLGWPLQTAALLLAPLTVVQPMLVVGLLMLVAIGLRVPGEHVTRWEVFGVLAIIVGVIVMALLAPGDPKVTRPPTAVGVAVLTALGLLVLVPYVTRAQRRLGSGAIALSAGLAYAWAAIANKLAADGLSSGNWPQIAGWLGGLAIASLIAVSSEMTSLQSRPATQVGPLLFVMETLVPVLFAPLITHEQWGHSGLEKAIFCAALVLTVLGAAVVARSSAVGRLIAMGRSEACEEPGGTGAVGDGITPGPDDGAAPAPGQPAPAQPHGRRAKPVPYT